MAVRHWKSAGARGGIDADLGRVRYGHGLYVRLEVLHRLGQARDAVALVEAELVGEGGLTEPHAGEGVEQVFVQVVRHPASVQNLPWKTRQIQG